MILFPYDILFLAAVYLPCKIIPVFVLPVRFVGDWTPCLRLTDSWRTLERESRGL